jgi:hypothetical protein
MDIGARAAQPRTGLLGGVLGGTSRLSTVQQENLYGYLFLLPWFVGMIAITLGPIIASLGLAFTDY